MKGIMDKVSGRGIKSAEVYSLNKIKSEIGFENNKLRTVKTSQNSGVAIRTEIDGKLGFTSSTNVENMDRIIDNAIEVTKFSGEKEFEFSKGGSYKEINLTNEKIWSIPDEQMIEDGKRAIEKIKKFDSELLNNISFVKEKTEVEIENTNGINASYVKDTLNITLFSGMVQGTNFIFSQEMRNSLSEKYDIMDMADRIIEKVRLSKINADFEPGNKPVIFTPDALSEILITLMEGVDGTSVEKGVSPLCGKIDEKVFDERITLVDDGILEGGVDSMPFDDEGTPAQRTVLFENGILKSYIHSLRTAAKLNQAPTGNGLKHAGLVPSKQLEALARPNITNWIMNGGKTKYDDMVRNIKDGVIIDYIMGIFMNNLLNGDFSGNIGIGYVVKDGKIVGRLKDAAINANIYKLFKDNIVDLSSEVFNISAIGNHRLPYMMLKDVYIAAKK